jgi:hypothetical protein
MGERLRYGHCVSPDAAMECSGMLSTILDFFSQKWVN